MKLVLVFVGFISWVALISIDSSPEVAMAMNKAHMLSQEVNRRYGFPRYRGPKLEFVEKQEGWTNAGEADCENWVIRLDHQTLRRNPDYAINYVLPHEFAHLVYCHRHGDMGFPHHNDEWREIALDLGMIGGSK